MVTRGMQMTYNETRWIVQEVEKAKKDYPSTNGKWNWFFHDESLSSRKVDKMDFNDVAEAVLSYYGVYNVGDIVLTKVGLPCLITYIEDYDIADTIHDVIYHVIYSGGIVETLKIDDITSKVDKSVVDLDSILQGILNKHY